MVRSLSTRMPRLGRWPRLALAGCCLLLALESAAAARGATSEVDGGVRVVAAARNLPAGRTIRPADVRIATWPVRLRPDGARARVSDLVGRRLAVPMTKNEAITGARLLGRDLTTGLGRALVALPVTLADTHAGDLLHPGDRVELYATPRPTDGFDTKSAMQLVPSVVGSRLLVLAVLPGTDAAGTELVVAADRATAMRITRAAASQIIAAVGDPP